MVPSLCTKQNRAHTLLVKHQAVIFAKINGSMKLFQAVKFVVEPASGRKIRLERKRALQLQTPPLKHHTARYIYQIINMNIWRNNIGKWKWNTILITLEGNPCPQICFNVFEARGQAILIGIPSYFCSQNSLNDPQLFP